MATPQEIQRAREAYRRMKAGQATTQRKQVATQSQSLADTFESAAKEIIGEDAVGLFGAGYKGLKSGVAGIVSLPRELPRLAEMGYEYATDTDVDFDVLAGSGLPTYETAANYLGATLPEDASEAEKAVYYGMESLPMFGGGGLLRTGIRGAQGALAGRVGEENALLGMAVGGAPEVPYVPGVSRTGMKTKKVNAIDSEAQTLAEDMLTKFGVQESRGQALYRAAVNEQNPERRIKKLAEAERVLALEEAGRKFDPTPDKPGVRSNVAVWKEKDINQAKQVESALRKIAGVAEGRKKPAEVKDRIVAVYKQWSKKRMQDFNKANEADFGKLDRGIKFNLENVVDEMDILIDQFDLGQRLQDSPKNTLLKIRNKILTEKGQVRELSAPEIQSILQDLGQIAYKGEIPGLEINPGVAKTVARRTMKIFDKALDNIATESVDLSSDQAKLLKTARSNFKQRVTALKDESSGVLLEFFNLEPEFATPDALLKKFESIQDDPRQVRIMTSIVQEEHPQLWKEVKQAAFNRQIQLLQDERGYLDITKLRQAKENLLQNELLFGDGEASQGLQQLEQFLDSMEGIFTRIDPETASEIGSGNMYRKGKLASEIGGSLGGPKARYVGEAATKLMMMIQSGRIPAEAAAEVAFNPKSQRVLVKALKGKANALTPKEMSRLRMLVRLGRIQTFATLPTIYFARDEEGESVKKAEDFFKGMFKESIEE